MNYILNEKQFEHLTLGGTLMLPNGDKIALADIGHIPLAYILAGSLRETVSAVHFEKVSRINQEMSIE
jgi:hypothetical protein